MPGNSTNHAKPGSQENSMRNERTFMQVRAKIIELENLLGGLHSEEMQYISRTMQDKDFRLKTRLTILTLDFFYLFNKKGKQFEWLKEGKLIHWWRKFSSLKDESDREIVKEMTQNWKEPNEETKKEYKELYSKFSTTLMELENIFFAMSAEEFNYISTHSEMQNMTSEIMHKFTLLLIYLGAINDLMMMYKRELCAEEDEDEDA